MNIDLEEQDLQFHVIIVKINQTLISMAMLTRAWSDSNNQIY